MVALGRPSLTELLGAPGVGVGACRLTETLLCPQLDRVSVWSAQESRL